MADLSTIIGVSADNISAYNGIDADTINTVMGLTWPHGPQYIGEFWEGGYYFGTLGGYYLLAADAEGYGYGWKTTTSTTDGSDSETDGYQNLQDQIAVGISLHPAGGYCNDLTTEGYTDWYFPAIQELQLIYENKATLTTYGLSFSSGRYYSSTESATFGAAEGIDFSDGSPDVIGKTLTDIYTRAIRRVAV